MNSPPILFFFSGDWDVHWGYDLGFDLWPFELCLCLGDAPKMDFGFPVLGHPHLLVNRERFWSYQEFCKDMVV